MWLGRGALSALRWGPHTAAAPATVLSALCRRLHCTEARRVCTPGCQAPGLAPCWFRSAACEGSAALAAVAASQASTWCTGSLRVPAWSWGLVVSRLRGVSRKTQVMLLKVSPMNSGVRPCARTQLVIRCQAASQPTAAAGSLLACDLACIAGSSTSARPVVGAVGWTLQCAAGK